MTDLRCPANHRKRFAKVVNDHIDIACPDCRKLLRMIGGQDVALVIHRYDLSGEFVDTFTIMADDEPVPDEDGSPVDMK